MKNIFSVVLLLVFLAGLATVCSAQVEEKKSELVKTMEYVKTLDHKIKVAREEKKINKIAELKELKRGAIRKAKALKAELEKTGVIVEEIIIVDDVEQKAGWLAKVGFGGGAAMIEGLHSFPVMPDLNLVFDGGLGIGNGYTIMILGLSKIYPLAGNYAGLELGIINYSAAVADVLGISGNISQGARIGIGVFGGTKVRDFDVQIGYNMALGITAGAVYKF